MLLSELIADLRLDLSDPGASLFEDQTLERCVRKAVFRVGRDLDQSLTITAGDKTGQPGHWAKLEADLLADYRQRLTELRPATQLDQEAYILTPSGLTPVIYEQGIDLDVVE